MKTIYYAPPTRKEYLSPECEVVNIKTEGIICDSGDYLFGGPGEPGGGFGDGGFFNI